MRYYKIRIGFGNGEDHHVHIDETELELAYYIYLTDSKAIFRDGPVRGKDIITIDEDWHKAKGWNPSYRLGPEDWADINQSVAREYLGVKNFVKEKVQHLIATGQHHLIGKNVPIPGFESVERHMPSEIAGPLNALVASKKI